jgi:hypothetical protein
MQRPFVSAAHGERGHARRLQLLYGSKQVIPGLDGRAIDSAFAISSLL